MKIPCMMMWGNRNIDIDVDIDMFIIRRMSMFHFIIASRPSPVHHKRAVMVSVDRPH